MQILTIFAVAQMEILKKPGFVQNLWNKKRCKFYNNISKDVEM